jgi:glycosyltransferase involved in cell wall biosynthesis
VRLVSGAADPVGAAVHALAIAEHLAARGHRAEVWLPEGGRTALRGAPGAEVREVPAPRPPTGPPAQRVGSVVASLGEALAAAEPADVHHAQDAVAAAAFLDQRGRGEGPAVVRTVHHVDPQPDPALEELQRASIQDVDALLCVSSFWADRLLGEYGVRATVIRNGVDERLVASADLDRATAGERLGWGTRPAVLALGGIARRKGSRVLLEAFARARARIGPGALLAIAGESRGDEGYRRAWREDAERLGLLVAGRRPPADAAVALLGTVRAEEMAVVLRAADALAYPSTREGSDLAVLEAAAGGLPAVVSDLPVLRENLAHGRDCLMVPAGDSGPLADALVSLVRDRALRARLIEGGRATAAGAGWAEAAAVHERVYGELLDTA